MSNINNYDLSVAYRIYPLVSKVPAVFPDDKLKLSELCLRSFTGSLGSLKAKFFVILDNCPEEYEDLFRKYIPEQHLELIRTQGIGNGKTFKKQTEVLLNQQYSDLIYFAEDDYFYLPDTFKELLSFFKSKNQDCFVSPYDHLDYYNNILHKYKSREEVFNGRKWQTKGSTCMTFLTSKKVLRNTLKTFLSYSVGNYDASLWFSLTKHNIYDPLKFMNRELFKTFVKAWLHGFSYNLFGKKRELWVPVPSIATHLDAPYLAPGINWEEWFARI